MRKVQDIIWLCANKILLNKNIYWKLYICIRVIINDNSYLKIYICKRIIIKNETQFLPSSGRINTAVGMHYLDTKRLEKKLDCNYTRMLRAILNKSWWQHPKRHQLYGHLSTIAKTIQVRRTRHAGYCWRSMDVLISDVLLWTPTYGREKAGRPTRTYIQQLCEDTGCSPEDLPEVMNDREKRHDMMMMRMMMPLDIKCESSNLDRKVLFISNHPYFKRILRVTMKKEDGRNNTFQKWIILVWVASPAVSCMSGASILDSFRDGRQVAV